MTTTALAPMAGERDLLEVVAKYDPSVPYQRWRPQILVPPTVGQPGKLPQVFVVVNQKGGAGKTTTALELGAAWVARGYRVRIIDADPQEASLSAWLAPQYPDEVPADDRYTLTDVYAEECTLDQATWPTRYEGLYIVPSGIDLSLVEYDPRITGAESALRVAIDESNAPFDITLIDCAPALGKLSISGLVAADSALIPAKVGGLDAMAMSALSQAIRKVQRRANPNLTVRAAILTAWDKSGFARDLAERIATDYPEAIIAPVRRSIRAAEAPAAGQPIREYDARSNAASDYDQVADLIIPRQVEA